MLFEDKNKYIQQIYDKSLELYYYQENDYDRFKDEQQYGKQSIEGLSYYFSNKLSYECEKESNLFNMQLYKEIKLLKASDTYLYEQNPNFKQLVLTHQEKYILYPRKQNLKEIINKVMDYQEANALIDFHPNVNDLEGDIKELVDQEMQQKNNEKEEYKEDAYANSKAIYKIRNIIHQSLQPYNSQYCTSQKQNKIKEYFENQFNNTSYDQWGKFNKVSPSSFLWLPAEFVYSNETEQYEIKGKLFEPLENCPHLPELKQELGQLMTYFSQGLKVIHAYFSELCYEVKSDYFENNNLFLSKKAVDFSNRIHAIVKISEIEIQPNSTYSGQWHVEGFSSDNILYTCLYVIEHDENLIEGKLKFKRTPRLDDNPTEGQPQSAHRYCPDYSYLCDPEKVIPLGSLDIKEDLMIIFPNQNIHKVKGIRNMTNQPLKRKIIAFFVVNNVEHPFTINDVEFTKSIQFIKQRRFQDMFERSKNKQTDAQSFNYCEH